MVIISILPLLNISCRAEPADIRYTIDPALAMYIREFKLDMVARGALPEWAPLPLVAVYGPTAEKVLGMCYSTRTVIIDQDLEYSDNEYLRKSTIYHEMAHCMAGIMQHSPESGHIMYWKHQPDTMENWDAKLDDLAWYIKAYSPIAHIQEDLVGPIEWE